MKSSLLNSGAAQLVRAAKYAHPSHCIDVGSAALRDLDCSDYNDGWNPCTLVLGANGDIIDTKTFSHFRLYIGLGLRVVE